MKSFIVSIVFLLIGIVGYSQSQMANYYSEQGKELYEESSYEDAIEQFEKALEKDPNHADALYYLGYSHYNLENYSKAVEFFNKLEKADPKYKAWYFYLRGKSNTQIGKLAEAGKDYQIFLNRFGKSHSLEIYHHKAAYLKYYAEKSIEVRNRKNTMAEPINLGSRVNSISDDMMPQIDPTGTKLYFTSERKGGLDNLDEDELNDWGSDLYFVEKVNGQWGEAKLLPEPINSYDSDGTSTFSPDGQIMIYVKCGNDGVGSCDLYMCELEGNTWSKPTNMGNVVNSDDWDSQPSLSADGQTLAFVSGKAGSYDDGMDIYISRKNKFGQWGIPQNAGSNINTPFAEKSPYLATDGKTMYFSSEGHPGFGDMDLFVSVFEDGKWSEPKNLGAPLNSAGEDTYFTISASGEGAYFASDRSGAVSYTHLTLPTIYSV